MSNDKIKVIKDKLTLEAAGITDRAALVMRKAVINQLISFCEQNEDFAECLSQTTCKFSDCLKEVAKNAQHGISDIEAYTRAVKFYMPDADIEFSMTIKTTASKVIKVDFLNLLDIGG